MAYFFHLLYFLLFQLNNLWERLFSNYSVTLSKKFLAYSFHLFISTSSTEWFMRTIVLRLLSDIVLLEPWEFTQQVWVEVVEWLTLRRNHVTISWSTYSLILPIYTFCSCLLTLERINILKSMNFYNDFDYCFAPHNNVVIFLLRNFILHQGCWPLKIAFYGSSVLLLTSIWNEFLVILVLQCVS